MALKQIVVELLADDRTMRGAFKRTERSTDRMVSGFKKLGGAITAALGARAIYNTLKQTLRTTDDLIKTAKGVGFSAKEYEKLTFALSQVGVEAGSARIAIGDFQKRLSKGLAGTSPAFAKAFKEAGLDIKALAAMSPAEAFNSAFMQLAAKANDPRAAGWFGNVFEEQSGKDMLKAARNLGVLNRAFRDFDRITNPLDTSAQKDLQELTYQTKLFEQAMTNLQRTVIIEAAPKITQALEQLIPVIGELAGQLGELVANVSGLFDEIGTVGTELGKGQDEFTKEWRQLKHDISTQGVMKTMFSGEDRIARLLGAGADRMNFSKTSFAGGQGADLSAWTGTLDVNVTTNGDVPANRRISKYFGEELAKKLRAERAQGR